MSEIVVEVESARSGNLGPKPAIPELFEERVPEIADSVAVVAEQFRRDLDEKLATRSHGPDEVELSFQLALQVQGGVVIKATGGATFGVKLTWKRGR
ncbi:CU044_2847 family protein [Saccharopolyspora sp. 5N708]|uniref:CU044_2847 family protein n=1 Tax=Saccharopolyspora sp. 5N708 TaxID=3457424 RepID=UPI003FD1A4B8